jgi:hypothetical protein
VPQGELERAALLSHNFARPDSCDAVRTGV